MEALPATALRISVLDRTKESGSAAEPLYLDVLSALTEHDTDNKAPSRRVVVGGRYGLGSKEFTPAMAAAVFENLALPGPKKRFTVRVPSTQRGATVRNTGICPTPPPRLTPGGTWWRCCSSANTPHRRSLPVHDEVILDTHRV